MLCRLELSRPNNVQDWLEYNDGRISVAPSFWCDVYTKSKAPPKTQFQRDWIHGEMQSFADDAVEPCPSDIALKLYELLFASSGKRLPRPSRRPSRRQSRRQSRPPRNRQRLRRAPPRGPRLAPRPSTPPTRRRSRAQAPTTPSLRMETRPLPRAP